MNLDLLKELNKKRTAGPRAEDGKKYYYVDAYFSVYQTTDFRDAEWNDRLYNSGNYFLTREEAQAFADKIKELRKTM